MRVSFQSQGRAGFTRRDLIAILGCIVFLVLFVGTLQRPTMGGKGQRTKCISNLKQIGLAFRIYASEQGDEYPFTRTMASNVAPLQVWHYLHALSNELQNTKILVCPADKARIKNAAKDFGSGEAGLRQIGKRDQAVSYFLGLSADEARPQAALSGDRNLSDSDIGNPFSSHRSGLISITGAVTWTTNVLVHGLQGNVALADGSVVQLTQPRLKKTMASAIESYGTNANLFLFPQ